jgi:uncharacterized membrane protein YhdT
MSRRAAAWLAWALWALSIALTVLSLWLLVLSLSNPGVHIFVHWIEATVLAIGFSTVGAVVAPTILKILWAGSFAQWDSYTRRSILWPSMLSTRS